MKRTSDLHGRLFFFGGRAAWLLPAALIAALRPFLTAPVSNPDLFWHLSAARFLLERGAFPRADFLSHTRAGRPWVNFEWGAGLLYLGAFRACGVWGLAALRAAAFAATIFFTSRTAGLYGWGRLGRAAAAVLAAAALWPYGDVRPDNFSLTLFAWLLWRLERWRVEERPLGWLACAAVFAAWANLHMGFLYGLGLLAAYAAAAFVERRRPAALRLAACGAAAAAGACLNPYGPALARVLWQHWRTMALISATIEEWRPPQLLNAYRWPFFFVAVAAVAGLAAVLARRKKGGAPLALCAVLAACLASAARHDRQLTFASLVAVPAAFCFWSEAEAGVRRRASAVGAAAAVAGLAMLSVSEPRAPSLVEAPGQLASFLRSEEATLAPLPLYNTWEDGGYLGWRLYPRYRVFFDGRYIFHDLLGEVRTAAASPETWSAFLDRYGVGVASMKRSPLHPTVEDGVRRPYYVAYMPQREWALVYWDEKRVLFVRRARAPAWAAAHELGLLRPDDFPFAARRLQSRPAERAALESDLRKLERAAPSALPEASAMARALSAPAARGS